MRPRFVYPLLALTSLLSASVVHAQRVDGVASTSRATSTASYAPASMSPVRALRVASSPSTQFGTPLVAVGVRGNGREEPITGVRVEEFASTRLQPLLNYVFFDRGSDELPARYRRTGEPGVAPRGARSSEQLAVYHDVLNIVGRRLSQLPAAQLTLVGTSSDEPEFGETARLARRRAESVRRYLSASFGIDTARISIDSRLLPEIPSNNRTSAGREENRRVEIYASSFDILEPVRLVDTTTQIAPQRLRIYANQPDSFNAKGWQLVLRNERDEELAHIDGDGRPPESIDLDLTALSSDALRRASTLRAELVVHGGGGQEVVAQCQQLPVHVLTVAKKRKSGERDAQTDTYSIVWLDPNRADFNELNRRVVASIASELPDDASISITAYTDLTSDDARSHDLTDRRARLVALNLRRAGATVSGRGPYDLCDNDLPEGRFYSRCVVVAATRHFGTSGSRTVEPEDTRMLTSPDAIPAIAPIR